MKGNILLSLLIVLFLGASAFLLGNASVSQAGENHGEYHLVWGELVDEYSECVGECDQSEGTRTHTQTRECVRVRGEGSNECERGETQERSREEACEIEEPVACEVPEEPKEPEQPQPSEPVAGEVQPASPPAPNQCTE